MKIGGGLAAGGLGKSFTTPASIRPMPQSEGLGSAQSWPPGPSSEHTLYQKGWAALCVAGGITGSHPHSKGQSLSEFLR